MKLPLAEAIAVTGAIATHAGRLPESAGVSTDTRTLVPGDLYVALAGANYDGHRFAQDALAKGACAALVSDRACLPDDAPALVVDDTLLAYQALGALARARLDARVVAITGSAGKTTTKALIAQLAAAAKFGPVAATPANENNEFGVPRLFLNAAAGVRFVAVEMGARRYGEIAPLARIARPEVAVVTNVGEAHLELMGTRERIAETKFGIFATDAKPVLHAFDRASFERASQFAQAPLWFAAESPPWSHDRRSFERFPTVWASRTLLSFDDGRGRRELAMDCRLPGEHNLANLAAAIAALFACGADLETLAAAVPSLTLPAGRYERARAGDVDVVYDAYNASMSGTLATLASFALEHAPRKLAVIGSMAELGPESSAMHAKVGAAAAKAHLAALLVGGDFAEDLARGARDAGFPADRIARFDDNDDAVSWLRANVQCGDLVLLKGSRRYRLEEVLEGLRAAHAG
ncbi:MAG: UDP-N-acetylmuramoyl-tripeptide--D-alanyl-D-alanine ligase [Candidatus Eremiobacteraeota bacterium]|nr:UDP-N-acetylmuramoyl-tripeptide--D-alanyl-D-alanine ligase [Candidatus Eremiobacteraeota bacterium]